MLKRGEQAAAQRAELEQLKEERKEQRRELSALNKARLRIETADLLQSFEGKTEENEESARIQSLMDIIAFYLKLPERPSVEIVDEAINDLAESIVDNEGGKLKKVRADLDALAKEHKIKEHFEKNIEKKIQEWSLETMANYETAVREAYGQVEILDDISTQVNRLKEMAKDIPDEKLVQEKVSAFEQNLRQQFKSSEKRWEILRAELPEKDCEELQGALDTNGIFAFIKKAEELKPILEAVGIEEVQKAWGMLVINRLQQELPAIARISDSRFLLDRDASRKLSKCEAGLYYYNQNRRNQQTWYESHDAEHELQGDGWPNQDEGERSYHDKKIKEAREELQLVRNYHTDAKQFFSQNKEEIHKRLNKLLAKYAVRSGLSFEQIWTDFVNEIQKVEDEINAKAVDNYEESVLKGYTRKSEDRRRWHIQDYIRDKKALSMKWSEDNDIELREAA